METGVKKYFNLSENDWNNRGRSVPLVEKYEEEWVEKNVKFYPEDIVLDYACGLGRWVDILHTRVRKIVAIDGSELLVKHLEEKGYENVTSITGEVPRLSGYHQYFTKIIFAQALEFFTDKDALELFVRFKDILVDKGQLFISSWAEEFINKPKTGDVVHVPHPRTGRIVDVFFRPRSTKEINELLSKAGFRNFRTGSITELRNQLPAATLEKVPKRRVIKILIVSLAEK